MDKMKTLSPGQLGEQRGTTLDTIDKKGEKDKGTDGFESGLASVEAFGGENPDSLGLGNNPANGMPNATPRDTVSEKGRSGTFRER